MGYGPEDKNFMLELTYNYGITGYDKGNAYAQITTRTDNVYKTAEAVKLFGGHIPREPGPLPNINTKITACLDPNGFKIIGRASFTLLSQSRSLEISKKLQGQPLVGPEQINTQLLILKVVILRLSKGHVQGFDIRNWLKHLNPLTQQVISPIEVIGYVVVFYDRTL